MNGKPSFVSMLLSSGSPYFFTGCVQFIADERGWTLILADDSIKIIRGNRRSSAFIGVSLIGEIEFQPLKSLHFGLHPSR